MNTLRCWGIWIALLAGASATHAQDLVFDSGITDPVINAAGSDFDQASQLAARFALALDEDVNVLRWVGVYGLVGGPTPLDDFSLRFFSITGGILAVDPAFEPVATVTRVRTGTFGGFPLFTYEATFPVVGLDAGEWAVSIVNDSVGFADDWYWAMAEGQEDNAFRTADGAPWGGFSSPLLFSVLFDDSIAGGTTFVRGDANSDGLVDISDAVFILASLFVPGSAEPTCVDAADSNDDGTRDISDAVFSLAALFVSGAPALPPPFPSCGVDPTMDSIDCAEYMPCP